MVLVEASKLALQSLWANKLRSVLTLLGVVIGVASVIMVVTLTNGAKQFVTSKLNQYGASVITISKMPQTFITIEEFLDFQKRRDITMDDFHAIVSECRSCVTVGARRDKLGKVVYGRNSTTDTDIRGWTWTMPGLSNLDLDYGRAFTELEDSHSTRVAMVGADIVNNMLGPGDPIGKEIRVDGASYTVIGVGEAQGKMLGMSMDNWVAIPLNAFQQSYGSHASIDIYVDAGGGGELIDIVSDQLRTIMRARRHLAPGAADTFSIDTSATFQNMLGKILNNFGAVVAAVAGISLVVGGIVIMNIMLVSVTERTPEIGLRKAVGANRRDIMIQFLVESATISVVGGLFGIVAGISVAKVITMLIAFPSAVKIWSVVVGLVVAATVGIFFGVYPAHKAAQLDPIAALRAEQ
ncbi:MAG TPA: ABC transporter permease [Terracidiphilus sp.]|jgi:putative ABC transport system permease protein|nr:ABC transporter permease [Terracidiphilus sp.]